MITQETKNHIENCIDAVLNKYSNVVGYAINAIEEDEDKINIDITLKRCQNIAYVETTLIKPEEMSDAQWEMLTKHIDKETKKYPGFEITN